jgi:hypothetical protein
VTDAKRSTPKRTRTAETRGRAEAGLEKSLVTRHEITPAARAALRTQARAVDAAEALADPFAVSKANEVYLALRKAEGLSTDGTKATDSWDQLLAEIARPTTDRRNAADT